MLFPIVWITNDKLSGGRAQAPSIILRSESSFYVLLKSFLLVIIIFVVSEILKLSFQDKSYMVNYIVESEAVGRGRESREP